MTMAELTTWTNSVTKHAKIRLQKQKIVAMLVPWLQSCKIVSKVSDTVAKGELHLYVRPVPIANEDQDANGRKYACPAGYEACNDDWFDQPDGAEFVACKPVGDQDFQCPITSIKF